MGVNAEITAMCQEAADTASVNAVYVLAGWLEEKGFPELAEEMKAAWLVVTEEPGEEPEPEEKEEGE